VLDAVGIQWVMSVLIALGLRSAAGVPVWALVPLVLVAWALWWTQANHVSRLASIIVQAVLVLGAVWVVAQWWVALAVLLTILSAFAIQRLTPVHSLGHATWHLLSATAQAGAALVLIV